ncbi:MFS transporter [Bacillus sp. Bva_UNVM-123]|uniref:CynX/NimT family MFS transporter n=1 Tax=Bacillus sp. Bva_UNVM-123 TaxID=2829798 RepID=UPI00391F19DC
MIGIIFVAFTLRPAITAVGPLVGEIRADTGISNGAAGLLTTLPLLAFGLLSPFIPKISRQLGNEWSILLGLIILSLGLLIRSTGLIIFLFMGTVLIGSGIAICNVLLPGIVKGNFPRKVGLLTGVYTLSMGLWAGLAPGLSTPLAINLQLGWQISLAVYVLLLFIAIIIWLPQLKRNVHKTHHNITHSHSSLWFSAIAWQVTFFMGLQSFVYFSITAWLPEILISYGFSIASAGWMVTLMQFSGLPANFIIPVLADRLQHQKGIALAIGLLCIIGLLGLLYGSSPFVIIICIIMIGIALGAAISHSLTLIGLRAVNARQASELSGMAQSVGYMLAAIGPFVIGFLFDLFHTWTLPLILLIFASVLFTIAGIGAGRNQYVLDKLNQKNKEASSTTA